MIPHKSLSEAIADTQKILSPHVKKPPLTEKLLTKPPFRFLHDVITAAIRNTGFLQGLFTDQELNSDYVKEKEAKIAFLTKLIAAIQHIANVQLSTRPSKIVAGLEPVETNILLQTIGEAIQKKLDSTEYVKRLHSTGNAIKSNRNDRKQKTIRHVISDQENTKTAVRTKHQPTQKTANIVSVKTPRESSGSRQQHEIIHNGAISKGSNKAINHQSNKGQTPQSSDDHQRHKSRIAAAGSGSINNKNAGRRDRTVTKRGVTTHLTEQNKNQQEVKKNATALSGSTTKPGSSRLTLEKQPNANEVAPPVLSDNEVILRNNEVERTNSSNHVLDESSTSKRTSTPRIRSIGHHSGSRRGSIISKEVVNGPKIVDDVVKLPQNDESKVRQGAQLRPPSVRPSSAKPGAPRLRPDSSLQIKESTFMGKVNVIVDGPDKAAAEDEDNVVIIQNHIDVVEVEDPTLNIPGDNKGHLVEQILEEIGDFPMKNTNKNANKDDWDEDRLTQDIAKKDILQLRSLVQTLTRNANPLGKLLYYLNEDIETMENELEHWINTKQQLLTEIAKQKSAISVGNKPTLDQLLHVEQQIKKQEEDIANCKYNIWKNDKKIREILTNK